MGRRISIVEMIAGWLLLSIAVPPPSAIAAPFCVETETVPPQCIFYDPNGCRTEAARQKGICVGNPGEVKLPRGIGKYCLAISSHAGVCEYNTLSECEKQAALQHTACVEAAPATPSNLPDPYRYTRQTHPN